MRPFPTPCSLLCGLVLISANAAAHHSSSQFDEKQEIELEGVVVKFEWANPHAYLFVRATAPGSKEAVWEIEAPPIAMLRRLGWSQATFEVGEHVTITAHALKNPSRPAALFVSAQKSDGTRLSLADFVTTISDRGPTLATRHAGLGGTWATLLGETLGKVFENDAALKDPNVWPLTAAGSAAVASFHEETDSPATECVPYTAPLLMLVPDLKSIEVRGDAIVIRGEFDGSVRTVHMDVDSHAGAEPSVQGHSIGRRDGDALVIDTRAFSAHRSGNNWSLPSGSQKHLVERLEPKADGNGLTYRFELEDPEYLTRTVTGEAEWSYRPDFVYAGQPCNLANARRFIGH